MNFNRLVSEWAWRVNDGMPDPQNRTHIELLRQVLIESGYDEAFVLEYTQNLTEEEKFKARSTKGDKQIVVYKSKENMEKAIEDGNAEPLEKDDSKPEDKEKEVDKTKLVAKDFDRGAGTGDTDTTKDDKDTVEASAAANKDLSDKIGSEKDPKKKESLKAEYLSNQLVNMLKVSSIESGAGRYNMNTDDVKSYRGYLDKIMNDPDEPGKSIQSLKDDQQKKFGKISESDIDNFIKDLEDSSKSDDPNFEKNIKSKVRGKGGPGSSFTTGEAGAQRYRNVIQAYLETGGISPITGKVVPFSECQLDHIISLGNEGKDEPSNWMFMEERFNQFKGKKTDEDIRADLEEDYYLTDAEIAAGIESDQVETALKKEDRAFWKNKFAKSKGRELEAGITKAQIEKMSKPQLANLVYGYNLANPENELSRYPSPKVDYKGKKLKFARGEGKDSPIQPIEGDPSTYGLSLDDDKKVNQDKSMDYEASMKAFKDNRGSGGREKSKDEYIETIMEAALASDSEELDERFNNMLEEHRTGQLQRSNAIKDKIKAAKELPGSMEQKRKIVTKSMKEFIKQNPEPFGAKSDNFIKDAKKRKKSDEWKEWKTSLDNYRYEQWSKFGEK
jgi:hypothetical protein